MENQEKKSENRVVCYVSNQTYAKLKELALKEGRSISNMAFRIIEGGIQ